MELGHAIGEESLLLRTPSLITVQAGSDVLLLRMPSAQFGDLSLHRPDVVQHIQVLKRRSMDRGYSFLTGRD